MPIGDYFGVGTTMGSTIDTTDSGTNITYDPGYVGTSLPWFPMTYQFGIPAYRDEIKLSELTKTMGSIIALTETLEEKKVNGLPTKSKEELVKHLKNYLVSVTQQFMEESQKPQAPTAFITGTGLTSP